MIQWNRCSGAILGLLVACCMSACRSDMARLQDRLSAIAEEVKPRDLAVEFGYWGAGARAAVNEDLVMHAASTMKLAVLLALLREDQVGGLSLDSNLPVVNRFHSAVDGSEFTLDPADDGETDLYKHVGESMHVRELARRMISTSSNLATNILMERLTAARVQQEVETVGANDTRIVRGVQDLKAFDAGLVNVTTAHDLALILQALVWEVANGDGADVAWPLQLLHHQEFNEMIPAGLPAGTPVWHKTGRITGIHHDAAIVVLPTMGWMSVPFPTVLVVMTRGFDDPKESAALGARVAHTIHEFVIGDSRRVDGALPPE